MNRKIQQLCHIYYIYYVYILLRLESSEKDETHNQPLDFYAGLQLFRL